MRNKTINIITRLNGGSGNHISEDNLFRWYIKSKPISPYLWKKRLQKEAEKEKATVINPDYSAYHFYEELKLFTPTQVRYWEIYHWQRGTLGDLTLDWDNNKLKLFWENLGPNGARAKELAIKDKQIDEQNGIIKEEFIQLLDHSILSMERNQNRISNLIANWEVSLETFKLYLGYWSTWFPEKQFYIEDNLDPPVQRIEILFKVNFELWDRLVLAEKERKEQEQENQKLDLKKKKNLIVHTNH
jgi:hypothetical protein